MPPTAQESNKAVIFNHLLVRSQNSALFRENIKSEIVKLLAAMRKLLIELGHRLHASNVLAEPGRYFLSEGRRN